MVFPLVPILANIFLYHESKWLKDCAQDFKPVYNKIFLNDILFNKSENAQFFSSSY